MVVVALTLLNPYLKFLVLQKSPGLLGPHPACLGPEPDWTSWCILQGVLRM